MISHYWQSPVFGFRSLLMRYHDWQCPLFVFLQAKVKRDKFAGMPCTIISNEISWMTMSLPKKPTRVAAPSPRTSLRRRTVCGRTEQRRPLVSKRYETKVRMVWVRMVWGSFLIAAAALKTPTINGYNAQGVNPTFCFPSISRPRWSATSSPGCRARSAVTCSGSAPGPRRREQRKTRGEDTGTVRVIISIRDTFLVYTQS